MEWQSGQSQKWFVLNWINVQKWSISQVMLIYMSEMETGWTVAG